MVNNDPKILQLQFCGMYKKEQNIKEIANFDLVTQ